LTQTGTPTGTVTQTGTPSNTHTNQIQSQQQTQDSPNTTYIAIGSVMGCFVLMTIVVVAMLFNSRQRKPIHYLPTMMTVPPVDNPMSSRVLQTRGLTTLTD
jgi:hypothetical protein